MTSGLGLLTMIGDADRLVGNLRDDMTLLVLKQK